MSAKNSDPNISEVAPAASHSPSPKTKAVSSSLDAIAYAAYIIYRRRSEQGLPGNTQTDWLEAERQLNQQK